MKIALYILLAVAPLMAASFPSSLRTLREKSIAAQQLLLLQASHKHLQHHLKARIIEVAGDFVYLSGNVPVNPFE
jgi:hypothetical protein